MARKLTSLLAALIVAVAALAPTLAEARDHGRGGYYDRGGYDRGYYDRGRGNYRHHDNDNDALAAGVIGLALGAIIGSAVTANNQAPPRYYQAPPPRGYYPPPPTAYYPPPPRGGYYGDTGGGYGGAVCVVRERQWDSYAGQYITVERRVRC